jgi:hypothetical protein
MPSLFIPLSFVGRTGSVEERGGGEEAGTVRAEFGLKLGVAQSEAFRERFQLSILPLRSYYGLRAK